MRSSLKLIVLAVILAALSFATTAPIVPVTGSLALSDASLIATQNSASIASQVDFSGDNLYSVVQQPKGNAGFVSSEADILTQFSLAGKYGSQGFLAHNYLAGGAFFDLQVGSLITVSYEDGHRVTYEVQEIRHFQAIHPNSPTTSFLDLDNNNAKMTTKQVFMQTYGVKGRLIFQTCIANGDELSWGRLFVIATEAEKTKSNQ